MNHYPVTIVENFYKDPFAVREFALKQKYKTCDQIKNIDHVFPGSRSEDISVINPELNKSFFFKSTSLFHNYDHDEIRMRMTSNFQWCPKKYLKGDIHRDVSAVFAGLVYLNPEPDINSGTTLYKKNDKYDEGQFMKLCNKNDDLFKTGNFDKLDYSYHEMFDKFVTLENSFNTLIMYEADIFHSANNFFGNTLEDSRLTQVFFIHQIDAKNPKSFPIDRSNFVNI